MSWAPGPDLWDPDLAAFLGPRVFDGVLQAQPRQAAGVGSGKGQQVIMIKMIECPGQIRVQDP